MKEHSMEHQNAATLPAGTKVRVAYTEGDSERYEHFEGDAVVVTPHPRSGALWQVALLEPTQHRSIVTNLSRNGAVIRVLASPVVSRPSAAERDYRLGLVYGVGNSALSDALSPPRQLDAVLEDPAVFTDLEGDEIRVDIVAFDQTEDAEAENAYPAGTVVEIECIVKPLPEDEDDFTSTASVYLNRETLRDLILHLVEVDEVAGYGELARSEQADLAESTAGDPPVPENTRLGCSGQCGACSR
jgi:hypothetical protein